MNAHTGNARQPLSKVQHLICDLMFKLSRIGAACILLLPVMSRLTMARTSNYSLFQRSWSLAQNETAYQGGQASQLATIIGTVTDVNGQPVEGATVRLMDSQATDLGTVTTSALGFFEFDNIATGISLQVTVNAVGFAQWESPLIVLQPGQREQLDVSKLKITEVHTTMTVSPESSEEIAVQQVKVEEKQRGLGIIPNFFTVYDPNPAPLTAKLKFDLSFRVLRDPFTFAGVAMIAGAGQASRSPAYRSGTKGYAERFGANYANQFTTIMIGGAILPTLLRQDPRYYYQGSGTKTSRTLHALSALVMTKGDNGKTQPNFSSLGGDLASAAIAASYYPERNEESKTIMENFAVNTAVHVVVRLLQEFVFHPVKSTAIDDPSDPAGGQVSPR